MNKFGDFHKLRLLNFDCGDTKENKVCEGGDCKPGHYYTQNFKKNLKCSTNGFIGKCSKWMKTKSSSETSFKEGSSRNTRISYIFKRQSNQSKRPVTNRAISLYNLKQNFSSTSFSFRNPIRKSLKTVTEKSLRRKQVKHEHYNKTDVQVLFMSETRKADRRLMKPNISEDKRKLDWINNSKSSNLFNYKSNQRRDSKKYLSHKDNNRFFKYFNRNYQNVRKLKQCNEKATDTLRLNDHTNYINSKPCGNTMHMCYNLVDFSCTACKIKETPYNECIHKISTIDASPCLNKQVWVTPPCRDIWKNRSGNLGNNKIINTDRTKNMNANKIQENEHCRRSFSKDQIRFPLCAPNVTDSPESLAKLTLKYFLIVISIIVWSPCILLMCIYWVVTYPARPVNILEKTNLSKSMIGCYGCCGRNCCQSVLHLFAILSDRVTSSYNTIFGLVKKQKSQESQRIETCVLKSISNNNCVIKTRQNLCPNPKNKYTLYYTRHRGWIMKPFKKRRRSINKRCECNIDEFPSSKEKSDKKIMRDQSCECFPEKLKDKIKSKTIRSLSRQSSEKDHPNVSKLVSQKTSPVSNINDGLPPKSRYTDASTIPSPHLTSNKYCCHEPAKNWQKKPRKNVSFDRNLLDTSDLRDTCNPQVMSPRLNVQSPFYPNTSRDECFPSEPLEKIIKGKSPCPCQQIRKISTLMSSKKPIPSKQNIIRTQCLNTKTGETASSLNIKPQLSYHKYQGKEKKLPKKNNVRCLCKSAREHVSAVVHDVECEVWKHNCCNDMYIHTLRRKPCFWVYKRCPSFYPYFLIFYKFYENVVIGLLFIISTCIWVPILCWCYVCFTLFCRCTKC